MLCEFYILSESANGKVIKCSLCSDKLAIMYNNISQSFSLDDFISFKKSIDTVKEEEYFSNYPEEEKIYLRTGYANLFFCFQKEEIRELRKLLTDGWFKFKLMENAKHNLN